MTNTTFMENAVNRSTIKQANGFLFIFLRFKY